MIEYRFESKKDLALYWRGKAEAMRAAATREGLSRGERATLLEGAATRESCAAMLERAVFVATPATQFFNQEETKR